MPKELFSESYEPDFGWGVDMGLLMAEKDVNTPFKIKIYLHYSTDQFNLSNEAKSKYGLHRPVRAKLTSIMLEASSNTRITEIAGKNISFIYGAGIGGSRFSLTDSDFYSLGRSTLTELREENGNTQLCNSLKTGLSIGGFGPLSLQYEYQLISVQRAENLFHWMVSTTISDFIIFGMPEKIVKAIGSDNANSFMLSCALITYKLGVSLLWYEFSYDNNNWPFHDDSPMHFHRQVLAISYRF